MVVKALGLLKTAGARALGFFGFSEEYTRFVTSGWKCPHCHRRLMNAAGLLTVNQYTASGKKLTGSTELLFLTGLRPLLRPFTCECPKCGHRWSIYGPRLANSAAVAAVFDIVEIDRSEEFFGEDRRVIDNSNSSTQVTRKISFAKEWSKSYRLEFDEATGDGAELTIGKKDTAALKLSTEAKLRQTYSVSQETKETVIEEVSCQVPARTMTTLVVRWKRIWQHGLIHTEQDGVRLHIPFRVAVALTFDQQQVDGELASREPAP
jgi:hypothetical protein